MVRNFEEFWGSSRRKGLFLIPRGMKKAYSPLPYSSSNINSDSSFSPFLEEDNFMRNWEATEIISVKNAWVWVSMVSYLRK
jgi:hypothetical protein